MRFDGTTYDASRDAARLSGSLERVCAILRDGRWHTLAELAFQTQTSEASVSARLRDLRKPRFGGYLIERAYVRRGLHRYRLDTRPAAGPVPQRLF